MTLLERFTQKYKVNESGCWVWIACIDTEGYARIGFLGKNMKAHRISYEIFVGTIQNGLQIDHLCRVRHCVNPNHLEAVTQIENIRRGDVYSSGWKRNITHCPKGHEYTDQNTRTNINKKGSPSRHCRTCQREAARRRAAEKSILGDRN